MQNLSKIELMSHWALVVYELAGLDLAARELDIPNYDILEGVKDMNRIMNSMYKTIIEMEDE